MNVLCLSVGKEWQLCAHFLVNARPFAITPKQTFKAAYEGGYHSAMTSASLPLAMWGAANSNGKKPRPMSGSPSAFSRNDDCQADAEQANLRKTNCYFKRSMSDICLIHGIAGNLLEFFCFGSRHLGISASTRQSISYSCPSSSVSPSLSAGRAFFCVLSLCMRDGWAKKRS